MCLTLVGNTQLPPHYCAVMEQDRQGVSAVCWVPLIPLLSRRNTAGSHAAWLSPIINRFLHKDVCLDLKTLSV